MMTLAERMGAGRVGLVGAQPVGNRWRAQGCIDGSVKYLGTFDTEQEAHDKFKEAVQRVHEARRTAALAESEAEAQRLADAPEFVYVGGVGRGANLNGKRFRLMDEDDGVTQHVLVAEVQPPDEGAPHPYVDPTQTRPLLRSYLRAVERTPDLQVRYFGVEPQEDAPSSEERDPAGRAFDRAVAEAMAEAPELSLASEVVFDASFDKPEDEEPDPVLRALEKLRHLTRPEVLAALPKDVADGLVGVQTDLVDGTRTAVEARKARDEVKGEVLRLLTESKHDLDWSITFLERHLRDGAGDDLRKVLVVARGVSFADTLEFLREHTTIDHSLLAEVERETVGSLFSTEGDAAVDKVNRFFSGKESRGGYRS